MNFSQIEKLLAAEIAKECTDAGQMTLGALIDALALLPADTIVEFDFGRSPGSGASYRGYYEQLAFQMLDRPMSVEQVLREAQACCDKTFEGYKGGDFKMGRGTWIWAGDWGTTVGSRRITGIAHADGKLVLSTTEDAP